MTIYVVVAADTAVGAFSTYELAADAAFKTRFGIEGDIQEFELDVIDPESRE